MAFWLKIHTIITDNLSGLKHSVDISPLSPGKPFSINWVGLVYNIFFTIRSTIKTK